MYHFTPILFISTVLDTILLFITKVLDSIILFVHLFVIIFIILFITIISDVQPPLYHPRLYYIAFTILYIGL